MKNMFMFGKVINGVMISMRKSECGQRYIVVADGPGYYSSNGILFTLEEAKTEFDKQVENAKER